MIIKINKFDLIIIYTLIHLNKKKENGGSLAKFKIDIKTNKFRFEFEFE